MEISLESLKENRQLIIPESEVTLEIIGDGTFTMPPDFSFPQITEISSPYCALKFTNKTFPNLEKISFLKLDSKKRMLAELPNLEHLKSLGIGPNSNETIFNYLANSRINELNLSGGKITSIDGISKIKELTNIRLHNLSSLTDISDLHNLNSLKTLNILYCTKLSEFDVVYSLKTLSELSITNCKAFDNSKYEKTINAMDINNINIWNP